MTSTHAPQPPYKQLRRPTTDRMLAGVASGVGRYFAVDPTLIRVVFAVATLLTAGVAALAYPVMWFLMPEEPAGAPAWPHQTGTAPHPTGPPQWPTPGPFGQSPHDPPAAPPAATTPPSAATAPVPPAG
ncbi:MULTISPECIES: PspC domain-containing protein [Micromonospora]|uniref:Phage shock protein C (PspC) family protein n=1 Tax=Micromonospora yangpuensis TaxID=683228 RepID=A0A1C6V9U1_9ACTN|nr:PspC domain-containing protein [Micromonospora yangpuensis]SCL63046.1 phage shock protein C (PspC) family protein [Micromonospora yangpuensis]